MSDSALAYLIHNTKAHPEKHNKYTWESNQLKRQYRLVIRQDYQLREDLLKYFHGSPKGGHFGAIAIMKRMRSLVYWKGLKMDVRQFVRA